MLATAGEVPQPWRPLWRFHRWRFHRLSPSLESEQVKQEEAETEDNELDSKSSSENLLYVQSSKEPQLVSEIQTMAYNNRTYVLDSIRHYLKKYLEVESEVLSIGIFNSYLQDLISIMTDSTNCLDRKFLFYFYGLILRESSEKIDLKKHLLGLLDLSHHLASHREGIALAIGLASSIHFEQVWSILEHFAHTRILRRSTVSSNAKNIHDVPWKWANSTALLCYGQMVVHAKNIILPWVDNITSRMVYYFNCSKYDSILKNSFLSATIMISTVLSKDPGAQNYIFKQIPDLIDCILISIQNESQELLVTYFHQRSLQVINTLCSLLQPSIPTMVKTRVLSICFESLFMLPAPEMLANDVVDQEDLPDIQTLHTKTMQALDLLLQHFLFEHQTMEELQFILQHFEPWLMASKPHERLRAEQTALRLLQYSQENLSLNTETSLAMMGNQIGLFSLLWRDECEENRLCAQECISVLIQLLTYKKPEEEHICIHILKQLKHLNIKISKKEVKDCTFLVKLFRKNLSVKQNTQLILTLMNGLKGHNQVRVHLALELFSLFLHTPGLKMEQLVFIINHLSIGGLLIIPYEDHLKEIRMVAEVFKGIHKVLPSIMFLDVRLSLFKVIQELGRKYTQTVVEVLLSIAQPMDRQIMEIWKVMGMDKNLRKRLMTLLFLKMKIRPSGEIYGNVKEKIEMMSIEALNTMYELLYLQEFRRVIHWAFSSILLGLLTQLHYFFETNMDDMEYFDDTLNLEYVSPFRTCLEALKGLFWTTDNWEVFAYMKLQEGWLLFERIATFQQGVTLLSRAITHYKCKTKDILNYAMKSMKKSPYERDHLVSILIITELLNSTEVPWCMFRRTIRNFLISSLRSSNKVVRIMSLQGLGSILLQPEKGNLLRNQLSGLIVELLHREENTILLLMNIIGEILHLLTLQGAGYSSLRVAEQLFDLFDDENERIRGEAIFLYGDVIHSGGKKFEHELKLHAFQCLVPLLFHLADSCPEVVGKTKFTFMRLAILFNWGFRKELFSTLAWREGKGAENDIFLYMVESNFGEYHLFLLQAFMYVKSPQKNLQRAAMKFIGGMLQEYFSDLCYYLNKSDMKLLTKNFEDLRRDQDPNIRKFYLNYSKDIYELSQYVA